MVLLHDIQVSNSRLASALPGLVVVFIGATSGIGEITLKKFAIHANKPRVYFTGQSQEAGERISTECAALNPDGKFIFTKVDTSLIRNIDLFCNDIKSKEKSINILFLSAGTLIQGKYTSEGLGLGVALKYYCRVRFIVNLLSLLQRATSLRRVVSVGTGTKEGPVDKTDFQGKNLSINRQISHFTSLVTISHAVLAEKAPQVSFVHDYPGAVKTGIWRGATGLIPLLITSLLKVFGRWIYIPIEESGERHLFLATSATYPASLDGNITSGVPLVTGVDVARGLDGKNGSGVYSVDQRCDSAGWAVEELLANLKKDGVVHQVWVHTEDLLKQITSQLNQEQVEQHASVIL